MTLKEYFEQTEGMGVLATADAEGRVDAAVYGRPHVMDEQTVAWIMADRRSHRNLQSNPHAAYLFREAGVSYTGKRLSLTKTGEEKDSPLIDRIRRRKGPDGNAPAKSGARFLVFFRVDEMRPLVGDGEEADDGQA